jgi:hypothetical protein
MDVCFSKNKLPKIESTNWPQTAEINHQPIQIAHGGISSFSPKVPLHVCAQSAVIIQPIERFAIRIRSKTAGRSDHRDKWR